jgi:preprotein translocase subunit SecA
MLSVQKVLTKVFGSRNDRLLKRYRSMVAKINELEPKVQSMTDAELRAHAHELRNGLMGGTIRSEEVIPDAFAVIRESMDRNIGIRNIFNPEEHFDPDKLDDKALALYDQVQQKMIQTGESWQTVDISPELYNAVRELYPESRPPFRARCFDVQLIGGLVLYEGKIAEMATGEGKTFVAPLACFMKVLEGFHTHVVTVNDYLVKRDSQWVKPAFEHMGFSVGYIQSDMDPGGDERRKQYQCDITYGTNSEFGFDYLRDNMKESVASQVQGPLDFAIVDEVDSILIDEARTPLIISGAAHDDAPKYRAADVVARKVIELNKPWDAAERAVDSAKRAIKAAEGDLDKVKGKEEKEKIRQRIEAAHKQLEEAEAKKEGLTQYYEVELDRKSVHLTHEGIAAAQEAAGVGSFYVGNNMEWPHLMEQALRAHVVYEKDKDYVVERGTGPRATGEMEVIIVDEYTGRKMIGRQWSDGLHQAVEAKEKVPIKQETQTLATITLQNFFKLYKSLSGMTGTAQTEAEEFTKIYRLEVVTIPTNRPRIREDHEDRVYRTEPEKWQAIIDEIKEISDAGRPVLVGTTSVEKSEMLSQLLKRKYGVEHEVLNAKYHEREAQIIALAGMQHQNTHGETVGNVTIATNMAGRGTDIKLAKGAHESGGLHVIGTERHTARRIDNQLRGRGGRQGDPGSSRFYVSLQDDLMKMFMNDWTINMLKRIGMEEGQAIEHSSITKGIIRAQKKVEERNFLARKNLLEYDEVMDHQRTTFYGMRQKVLIGRDVDQIIWEMIGDSIADAVEKYVTQDFVAATIAEWSRVNFEVALEPGDLKGMRQIDDLEDYIKRQARAEAETNISATLGEFMGEDHNDSSQWDTKGLASWAMSRFQVNLSQKQIREMDAHELEEKLREAAIEQIVRRDCAGIMKYLVPNYALQEMSRWAQEKFGIQVSPSEMLEDAASNLPKDASELIELLETRARQAYEPREVEYPVDEVLARAFGELGNTEFAPGVDFVRWWANKKFGVDLTPEHIRSHSVRKLREELVALQEKFVRGGGMEAEVDRLINANADKESLARAVNERFDVKLTAKDLEPQQTNAQEDGEAPLTTRDIVLDVARQFFRRELTMLEQYVLINIFDQTWKDHLYAMDMLKNSIGLQSFAEQDPRVLYKKEGFRYFEEMMVGVRDKVTDLIFRARVVGQQPQQRSAYRVTEARHDTSNNYGVTENLRETAAAVAVPTGGGGDEGEMQEAANQVQGEGAKVKQIVREDAKIGRNDPCPCGSGKKYKKCCGANVV